MLRSKGKIILTLVLTLLFGALLITAVSALEGENITIQFYTTGNAIDKSINTNGIVEGEISIVGGKTVKLPSRDVETGKSFNWRTEDGRAWEGGSTVTFYEDTRLFPVTAIDISTADEMYTHMPKGATVRLLNDLYLEKKPDFPWPGTCTVLLNGKTLEINSSLGTAWGGQRCGTFFYGVGTVKYSGTGVFMNLQGHSWGGDCCRLFVGSSVTIDAPKSTLGRDGDGSYVQGYPWIQIFGTVNCNIVLDMANSGNRNPRIEVYDGAQLNINGQFIKHSSAGNTVRVNISGGNIKTSGSNSLFADGSAVFAIEGGVFDFSASSDASTLQSTIDIAYYRIIDISDSNGKAYVAVVPLTTCKHEYKIHSTYQANCSSCAKDNIVCGLCEDHFYIAYGEKGPHAYSDTVSAHKEPTKTSVGWDKYSCSDCSSIKLEYIYYDPTNDNVKVIVNEGTGEKTVTAKVKEVFVVDANYHITGIKAFGSYQLSQIVGVYVPVGIAKVNITTTNEYVKSITFGEGLVAEVTKLTGLSKLENIVIENVAELIFASNCAPSTIKSIKSDVSGANVEYAESAFSGKSSLVEMTFSKNSTYIFGKQSFKSIGAKSIVFVDGCKITFKGPQAFSESKVEYVYFGKGITEISNYPFDNGYYLQKIVMMDITKLNDWAFSRMNKGATSPVVYHHASSLQLGENTFYEGHGITVYTTAPITTGFKGCSSYTIHYGITHGYERIETDPTCTAEGSVKYVTDCPCGVNDGTSHKVFKNVVTNNSTYTIEDYTDKIKEMLPHDLSSVGQIQYTNGYTKYGYYTYDCSMCHQAIKEDKASCPPLVITYGYSVTDKDGIGSINVKYSIDEAVLALYESTNGVKLNYGTVVAVKKSLNGQSPLDASGKARNGVLKLDTSKNGYSTSLIKLTNLKDANKTVSYVMSIYIIDGSDINYIQDTETVKNPSGVTYKEIKELAEYYESLALAIIPQQAKEF